MADVNERDAKLVQYLSEAYGKERELETSLQAHIAMTTKTPYRKRLQQHLRETKGHAKGLERRIKKLGGGGAPKVQTVVAKAMAATKGPLHLVRGSGEQEKMLKNAKTEYFNEHEEIATYLAIEVFAEKVGDRETAKLAKEIRRDEERMAKFLEAQIKSLTGAVVAEDVPPAQRRSKPRASARRKSRTASKPKSRASAKAKPRSAVKAKRARKRAGSRSK
jgi:ferritin-like metal-binding protein YciE